MMVLENIDYLEGCQVEIIFFTRSLDVSSMIRHTETRSCSD